MTDTTWVRVYNGKSIYADSGVIRTDNYFDRRGYAGTSWNDGIGAYNVGLTENSAQTPIIVAYNATRGGSAASTGDNRLFALELLNSGGKLHFAFGGENKFEMTSWGDLSATGNIGANGSISAQGNITAGQGNISASNGKVYGKVGVHSDGYVSAKGQNTSSDARLKRNLTPFEIELNKIANAPSVGFDWLDGTHDLGSIAQYWHGVNPLLTPKDPDGYLTLQYGKTALLASITIAKKVMSHEERIAELERENEELRAELKLLRGNK